MTSALEKKIEESKKQWQDVAACVKHARRVLLWGPPGTGKSFIGTAGQENISRVYLTLDTPAAEVRGHYLPSETGGFKWHDGPGVRAWRNGHRLVIDEIDAASGDTLTVLLGLLDDPESARLTLPSNETLRPADGFSCVATTNQSPTTLPDALLDRFDAVLRVDTPNPEVFDLGNWHSKDLAEHAKRVIYLRENQAPATTDSGQQIGVRAFRSIDRFVAQGIALDDAARLSLGKSAGEWFCKASKISSAA